MEKVNKKLRVGYLIPEAHNLDPLNIEVKDEVEVLAVINGISKLHNHLTENDIMLDYSSCIFVEMLEDDEWVDYMTDDGLSFEECFENCDD